MIKLNNMIFPFWFMLFFPPLLFVTVVGNYLIDSLVLYIIYKIFKEIQGTNFKEFYDKHFMKVYIFGFIADILGGVGLYLISNINTLDHDIIRGLTMNPFTNLVSFLLVLAMILFSGILLFVFNYQFIFSSYEKKIRIKLALFITITTLPVTFLLPTQWFNF